MYSTEEVKKQFIYTANELQNLKAILEEVQHGDGYFNLPQVQQSQIENITQKTDNLNIVLRDFVFDWKL